jgi:Pyridoxamine 5'-phosphate oxidase
MPKPPVSSSVDVLLRKPNPAVVASLRPNGTPHTATTWYDWRDGRILLNMDASRKRLNYMRLNRNVSVSVIDKDDMYRSVSLTGRVEEILLDEGLVDIDALCQRYLGSPYPDRATPRFTAWVTVDSWFLWDSYRETAGLDEIT